MKAPEKIYVVIDPIWGRMSVNYNRNDVDNIEYIRKDIVDDMLATAEDHAYFAGSESTKEKLTDAFIKKAEEWLRKNQQGFISPNIDIEDFFDILPQLKHGDS